MFPPYWMYQHEGVAAWRYLDYQFKGGALDDMATNEPLIGATFRW